MRIFGPKTDEEVGEDFIMRNGWDMKHAWETKNE
jgi:hypothetical protein